MSNDDAIPPVKKLRQKLDEFAARVPIWSLTLFTVDGYIIAHRAASERIPDGIEMAISSMSAGLITISEDFIRMIDASKMFRSVLVDSVDEAGVLNFSILLGVVADNVLLSCVFPRTTQLGLITFELETLGNEIRETIREWDVKLHSETMT